MNFGMREKLMLRELSSDSRASVTRLAKIAKCSRVTAGKLVDVMSKELDIRFTLEVDLNTLGALDRHVIAIKLPKKPKLGVLEDLFAKEEKYVHDVYLTEGDFDLVVIATASNPIDYIVWETHLAEVLSPYTPNMKPSDISFLNFGYVPLNDSFVYDIRKEMKIDSSDRELLRLLNKDSRMSYSELGRQLNMNEDTVRYKVFKLKKSGIIKRFTIAVQRPPQSYILIFFEFWNYITPNYEERAAQDRAVLINADKDMPLLDTFQLSAPLTGSYGNFIMGIFNGKSEALRNAVNKHKKIYERDKVAIKQARIVKVLKGMLPLRNLDIKTNYLVVKWE
ncbi:MAG: AsnC family transcriptional regulator [Candidatus Marsarchaeota archaeon]|nr:AsnC family transcriptional regulator [Candidatus Marsarchaeota archaeon]